MKVTENEIRPEHIFNEYLRLTAEDTIVYFKDAKRIEIPCPACGNQGSKLFNKVGFDYENCSNCKSIYVSPRPVKEAFDKYYTDSPSTEYWATTFYKVTEAARREKLWKPKALLIKDRIEKYQQNQKVEYIIDIGGGYGVFDEEIKLVMDIKPIIIEPSIHLAAICREKQLTVVEKFMEDIHEEELPEGRKCYVSFELFEHLHDPTLFLQTVFKSMRKNDLFIFTTLSSMGLDIQVLKEHAKALSPPHHLNFLNPKSVSTLLEKLGFDVLEAITPGKLDMDILLNNKQFIKESSWKNIIDYSTTIELEGIQQFIANSGLSSHMMITCTKRIN
jgi:hypothetical protein